MFYFIFFLVTLFILVVHLKIVGWFFMSAALRSGFCGNILCFSDMANCFKTEKCDVVLLLITHLITELVNH